MFNFLSLNSLEKFWCKYMGKLNFALFNCGDLTLKNYPASTRCAVKIKKPPQL